MHQEDENYKYFETLLVGVYIIEKADSSILTAPSVAEQYYGSIDDKPKSLLSSTFSGSGKITYEFWVKTSDIDGAGTDANIYIKIGNGEYQELYKDGDELEQDDLDKYAVDIDSSYLYNNFYGTIPVTFMYEKRGSYPGWHCEYVKLNVYKNGSLIINGNNYKVNHWFGT